MLQRWDELRVCLQADQFRDLICLLVINSRYATWLREGQTAVHLMNYHFAWCPKYRRKVLVGKIAQRLETLIREKTAQLNCEVLNLSIAADHVHLFIQAYPLLSPNRIIAQIKGYTSRVLRREFPELLKIPTLWTRSYFVSTAGNVSGKVIAHYIEAQKRT